MREENPPSIRYRDALATWRTATRGSLEAQARLRAAVSTSEGQAARRPWAIALAGAAVAGAVVWALQPAAPSPVSLALSAPVSEAPSMPVQVSPEVAATVGGLGQVTGDTRNVHVAWEKGTLSLEVEPDRGINLAVETDEATVRVVGTGFDVARDAFGTRVSVRHGRVAVVCSRGAERMLGAGEHATCLPRTAAGMLGRARALQDVHAPTTDQLGEIGRAHV